MLLHKIKLLFSSSSSICPYLSDSLKLSNLLPLRTTQLKTLQLASKYNNILINEPDGAGKTLAYLIPILNETVTRIKQKRSQSGAVIVTINKQLSLQIYQLIRRLDPSNLLQVNRCGSIAHYSPVIEEMCKPSSEQDKDLIIDLMNKNVADSVRWPNTHILITTPKMLYRILEYKIDGKKAINPQYIVLDEADVILKNNDLFTYTNKCLQYFQTLKIQGNEALKYFLASPNNIGNQSMAWAQSKLPQSSKFVSTDKIGENIYLKSLKLEYIRIKSQQKQQIYNQKIQLLIKLLGNGQRKRVLIFCQKRSIEVIKSGIIKKTSLIPTQFYADMSTEKRMMTLFNIIEGKSNILISTNLGSRGFNFGKEIDCIISFDMSTEGDEIDRVSRGNKLNGQHIFFVEEDQMQKMKVLMDQVNKGKTAGVSVAELSSQNII